VADEEQQDRAAAAEPVFQTVEHDDRAARGATRQAIQ